MAKDTAEKFEVAVALVAMSELSRYERNARTHPQSQIEQIKASIRSFGFANPIIADLEEGGTIAAGHGRLTAVEQMLEAGERVALPDGRDLPDGYLPVVDCAGWSEEQRRAYTLADNRIAENSGWDEELLKVELDFLAAETGEDAFDLTEVLGFDQREIDAILGGGEEPPEEKEAPEPPADPVSDAGDIWVLGNHRIRCGSSTEAEDVEALLAGATPHLMVTDPPYGVNYDPKWRAEVGVNKNKGKMGVVQNDDRADWREAWALFPGAVAYVWHAGLFSGVVGESLMATGFELRSQIVWAKDRFALSRSDYHWQHEPCWYAVKKGKRGNWSGDRSQSTLWSIPAREDKGVGHGTQKPIDCMRRPMLNNSKRGDAVYEPFSGSGTTIIAGEMEGRHVYAMELFPAYVDVAVLRWQEMTGRKAVLDGDGRTFEEVSAARKEG